MLSAKLLKIIIAADNDGPDSITGKTVLNAKVLLEEKGAFVEVVKPDRQGDFNDLLKAGDSKLINSLFAPAIASHSAKTLQEYVDAKAEIKPVTLDENDKANLAYIEKYDLPQEVIVDSYRKGELQGKLKLEHIRKGLEQASNHFNNNKASDKDITKSLVGMDEKYSKEHCTYIRNSALNKYFTDNLNQFEEQKKSKFNLESLKPIMVAEQGFLKKTYESIKSPIKEQGHENQEYLQAGQIALKKPKILEEIFGFAEKLAVSGTRTEESLLNDLKNTTDLKASHEKMGKELETHLAKEAIRDVQRDSLKYLLELREARKLSTPPEQQNENCDKTPNSIRFRVEEDSKMLTGDYINNQHIIDKTLRNFDGPLADYVVLKKTIGDLQRFGKPEELRDGLILFKDKGIKAFSCYTSTISSNNIRDSINKDFSNILKGKDIELVDGSKCSNKSEYLIALSKDEQIMRYIEPRSDIGKEIQNQQSIQNEKTKDYDFER